MDHQRCTNVATLQPSGHRIGQNGAEFHAGTTRVPLALHWATCQIVRQTRCSGGNHQLILFSQLTVKVSTASQPATRSDYEISQFGYIVQPNECPPVCSPLSVVQNAKGKLRLVLDLRYVNKFLPEQKLEYEGLNLVHQISAELNIEGTEGYLLGAQIVQGAMYIVWSGSRKQHLQDATMPIF